MKRSTPLRRTSSLRSTSTLTRRARLSPRSKTNSYRKRPRDIERMLWVKKLPCVLRELPLTKFVEPQRVYDVSRSKSPCSGRVEADHQGARGMGQKASDDTVVPLCAHHHRARHDHAADFRPLTRDELRAWRAAAIERTQAAWENR